MNTENITEKNGIYYYRTNSFATIKIKFTFLIDNDEKTLIKANLLSIYLIKANKTYKTFKEVRDKAKELYNANIKFYQNYIGNKNFFNFEIEFLNPKIIDENYLKEIINFAKELLYNPNFDNNKLNPEIISQIKKDTINNEKSNLSNAKTLSRRLLISEIAPNSNLTNNTVIDIEKEKQLLNEITDKEIIDFYNNTINNNFWRGFIFGDINEEEYNLITNTFPFKGNNKKLDYFEPLEIRAGYQEKTNNDIKSSSLYVVYQLNNYNTNKLYLYKTISLMLSNTNGLCHKILRDELGIVYSAGPVINDFRFFGFLIIEVNISGENKDKCLKGIDEIWKRLKDKKVVSELLKYAVERQNQEDDLSDENVTTVLTDLGHYCFETRPTREKLHTLVNQITVKDIINEIDNIEKKYIFFYKGEKNEK